MNWIKRLFVQPEQRELDLPLCHTCEILQIELDHARREKLLLMEALIEKVRPKIEQPEEPLEDRNLKPISIGKRHIPHQVRSQMIRESDNHLLKLMQDSKKEMAEARVAAAQVEEKTVEGPDTKQAEIELLERDILNAGAKNG